MTWQERKTARFERSFLATSVISLGIALLVIAIMWFSNHVWHH